MFRFVDMESVGNIVTLPHSTEDKNSDIATHQLIQEMFKDGGGEDGQVPGGCWRVEQKEWEGDCSHSSHLDVVSLLCVLCFCAHHQIPFVNLIIICFCSLSASALFLFCSVSVLFLCIWYLIPTHVSVYIYSLFFFVSVYMYSLFLCSSPDSICEPDH